MVDMLQTKVDCLAEKIYLVQKNTEKRPFLGDKNWHQLPLGGPGCQTVDTSPVHLNVLVLPQKKCPTQKCVIETKLNWRQNRVN